MRNLSAVNLIWFVGANRDPGDSGHRDLFFVLIFLRSLLLRDLRDIREIPADLVAV